MSDSQTIIQYGCHSCNSIVTDVDETEDGFVHRACGQQYVERIERRRDASDFERFCAIAEESARAAAAPAVPQPQPEFMMQWQQPHTGSFTWVSVPPATAAFPAPLFPPFPGFAMAPPLGAMAPWMHPQAFVAPGFGPSMDDLLHQMLHHEGPSGTPPTAATTREQLPEIELSSEQILKQNQCFICFEEFQVGEKATAVPCGHMFHRPCIMPWLIEHSSCPVCRHQLESEDTDFNQRMSRRRDRAARTASIAAARSASATAQAAAAEALTFPSALRGASSDISTSLSGAIVAPGGSSDDHSAVSVPSFSPFGGSEPLSRTHSSAESVGTEDAAQRGRSQGATGPSGATSEPVPFGAPQ